MSVEWVQKIYDKIKNWEAPEWFKDFLLKLQELIISILTQVGKDYIESIKNKIIEVSKEDIDNEEKFNKVFTYIKTGLELAHLKDSVINLVIELLVNSLKKDKII